MPVRRILICLPLVIIMSISMVISGCDVLTGSGQLTTQDMEYADFTKIEVGYAFDVEITRANSYLVRITIDEELYEYLVVDQRGDTLYIRMKPNYIYANATRKALITLPDLHGLELSGASKGNISGFSSSHSMDFELSGASQMDISDMTAGDVSLDLSGASKASGRIDIADGMFDLSGASSLELVGSANDIDIDASGASRVGFSDFSVFDIDIDLSGASSATIDVSGRLDCSLSGASRLYYTGNPTLGSIETSGGSTISQK